MRRACAVIDEISNCGSRPAKSAGLSSQPSGRRHEAHEVEEQRGRGVDGQAVVAATPALKRVCDGLLSGRYSDGDTARYHPIVDSLTHGDWFMVASDFAAYAKAQAEVSKLWTTHDRWTEKAIVNTVNMGWFSSDRTIRDYARDIWGVPVRQGNLYA